MAVVVAVAYPLWLAFQIWQQSDRDENRTADAIVVLGAAQYDGEPSPVFRARLDQAAYLYNEGFSSVIIVTGGKQEGDRFTEAEAGSHYLVDQGIPAESILQEGRGTTTLESLSAVYDMTRDEGIESVLLVSDPMHSERLKRMASDLGFASAHTSYASYERLNRSRATKLKELAHEVAAIISYEWFDR